MLSRSWFIASEKCSCNLQVKRCLWVKTKTLILECCVPAPRGLVQSLLARSWGLQPPHEPADTLLHLQSLTPFVHAIILSACVIGSALCKSPVLDVIGHWLTQLLAGNLHVQLRHLSEQTQPARAMLQISAPRLTKQAKRKPSGVSPRQQGVPAERRNLLAPDANCKASFTI